MERFRHIVGRYRRCKEFGHHCCDLAGQCRCRGHNPCFRQRQLLPKPCFLAIVIRQPVQPRGERAFLAIGAEPRVDAEQHTFARGAAQPAGHGLGQPREIGGGAKRAAAATSASRLPVIRRVPGEDQIEVGCGGEVALTQPAHGEHQDIPLDYAVAAFHVDARKITDDADHRFRPVGQCASDRDAVGDPAQPLHLGPEPALARFSCDEFQSAFDRHVTDAVPEFGLETVGIRQRREEITEQHQIEQHWMVSERCSEPWRQH